jgi:cell division protein FtsW (lipid II flippase)
VALAETAALMADARQSLSNARKNEAMRELLVSAGWQWAGAMALGHALLVWSRRSVPPALGVGVALAVWSAAAWLARVPWPLAANREFEPARLDASLASAPAPYVIALAGVAALLLGAALLRGRRAEARLLPAQSMSSRIGFAGLALATGIGWLLLLDLSSQGLHANRYLALYHQGHLWLGLMLLSVLVFLRQPLSRGLAWMLSVGGEAAHRTVRRVGHAGALAALLLLTFGALAAVGLGLSNLRQLTSELGRVWLIVGAAWFFFLRGGPLADRLARHGATGASFLRYAWPLLFVIGVLVAAMLITRDMGPLLIAAYASGAFLAASLAMWWQQRSGRRAAPFVLAVAVFAAWIGGTTWLLLNAGSLDAVTASRLESMAAPFASINDQLALVSWFRDAAPPEGFAIGTTPWCGFVSGGACSGVPAQVHSDYTFTAIVGVFGTMAAWTVSLGTAVWLHRLIRHHGRVTRGEPQLLAVGGQIGHDGQALLSWLAIAWVVLTSCQLAVTVAGNLAVLPLTGVTFPFVSFGMTSLLVNMAFLGLCLNVDVPARGGAHG